MFEILISDRMDKGGILPDNKKIFGVASTKDSYHCHSKLFASYGSDLGVKNVSSRTLRTYLCTSAQVQKLSEVQLEQLSRHMGHSIHMYMNQYWGHSHAVEKGVVSLFLKDAEKGNLARAGQIVDGGRLYPPLDDTELRRLELDEDGRPGEDGIAGQARQFQWAMDEDVVP